MVGDNMKVGDYVRTKNGEIGRVIDRYKVNDYYKVVVDIRNGFIEKHKEHLFKKYVKVSSPNITDLIEVGDIIKKTYKTGLIEKIPINKIEDIDNIKIDFKNGFNLSILTREQFESMEYKIK